MPRVKCYTANINGSGDLVIHEGAEFIETKAVDLYNFVIQQHKEGDGEITILEAEDHIIECYHLESKTHVWNEEDRDGMVEVHYEWIDGTPLEDKLKRARFILNDGAMLSVVTYIEAEKTLYWQEEDFSEVHKSTLEELEGMDIKCYELTEIE